MIGGFIRSPMGKLKKKCFYFYFIFFWERGRVRDFEPITWVCSLMGTEPGTSWLMSWCSTTKPHWLGPRGNLTKALSEQCTYLFFFMMCSKGLKKSFWKRKLANSPFSRNFMESCRNESTAKIATSSLGLQPTWAEQEVRWNRHSETMVDVGFWTWKMDILPLKQMLWENTPKEKKKWYVQME